MKRGVFIRSLIGLPALFKIAPTLVEDVAPLHIRSEEMELLEFSMVPTPINRQASIGTCISHIEGDELICQVKLNTNADKILDQLREAETKLRRIVQGE